MKLRYCVVRFCMSDPIDCIFYHCMIVFSIKTKYLGNAELFDIDTVNNDKVIDWHIASGAIHRVLLSFFWCDVIIDRYNKQTCIVVHLCCC